MGEEVQKRDCGHNSQILELIHILEDLGALRYIPIFLKNIRVLAMNGKNRENEVVSTQLSVHIESSSIEDIASDFVILLEEAIANVVVLLAGITKVAALGKLDGSSKLSIFLAEAMLYHVLVSL